MNYVDHTKKPKIQPNLPKPRVGSLCTGYGGLELGLELALGCIQPVFHVEMGGYPATLLASKMEKREMVAALIWTDVKPFPSYLFRGGIDFLAGGYPCQPFSNAGKKKGKEDARHLWPWFTKIIATTNPQWCFFENVSGHLSDGLPTVIADLQELGFDVAIEIVTAEEVGATQKRERVFILAHSNDGHELTKKEICPRGLTSEFGGTNLARNPSEGLQRTSPRRWKQELPKPTLAGESLFTRFPAGQGTYQHDWEQPRTIKPRLGRAGDGPASRVDRLHALGNGVIPAQAAYAFTLCFEKLQKAELERDSASEQIIF